MTSDDQFTTCNADIKGTNTTSARIIPFRTPNATATLGDLCGPQEGFIVGQEEKLMALIKASVYEAYMQTKILPNVMDDPFDAIYLSDLKSDAVTLKDVECIMRLSSIEDLSSTISFDDEWED